MILPISAQSTQRKCSVCQNPASVWNFKKNKFGGVDTSSKSPRCSEHEEAE